MTDQMTPTPETVEKTPAQAPETMAGGRIYRRVEIKFFLCAIARKFTEATQRDFAYVGLSALALFDHTGDKGELLFRLHLPKDETGVEHAIGKSNLRIHKHRYEYDSQYVFIFT